MASVTLYSGKDASIQEFKPDKNYGSDYLRLDDGSGSSWRTLLEFDVSSLPSADEISSVTLYLFRRFRNKWRNTTGTFNRVTGAWAEDTVTWGNQPVVSSDNECTRTLHYGTILESHGWDSFDVTQLCKDARVAGDVFGVRIRTAEDRGGDFQVYNYDSREKRVYTDTEPYSLQKPYLLVEYAEPPELALSGIEIVSRYGSKFYLQGEIQNIVSADELCLMYSRPGSADLLNLPSLIIPYTYMKGTSGTFDLQVGGKYLEFSASGYYIFELWRVSGTCETRTEKVAEYFLKLEATEYQYQLYFDLDAPEIVAHRHLLQGEYDKYNAAKPWTVVPEGEDCFSRIEPSALYVDGSVGTGWLCQAGEFLSSGCSPLPWWVCPDLTDWDIYMRGECSCSDFKDNLQPLGIPCMHLIAAKEYYGDNPPYCPYKVCG